MMVGIGGAIGSCLRYGLARATLQLGWLFPLGTLLANVIAGLGIGFVLGMEAQALCITPKAKVFLNTGLMGGLSTFSTFSWETVHLYSEGNHLLAVGNVVLNLSLSLLGVVLGMALAKMIKKA
jgi:CrcB protein